MNNLHRELAPISDAAWAQIEEETTRTLKRYLAGRRVVDVPSPGGIDLPELQQVICCRLILQPRISWQGSVRSKLSWSCGFPSS